MSSASSKASSVASSVSSSLSKAIPSATAAAYETGKSQTSTQTIIFTTIAITTTTILLVLAGIYYSGYADDILEAAAKKYYSAKAQAEATALAHTGSEKVQGVLKDSLKGNPVMGEDELEQVSGGLGKEAASEGLGGVSEKLGGLGKQTYNYLTTSDNNNTTLSMSVASSIKTTLIIGATSGIGESFARRFHSQGKKVIATGRREANLDLPNLPRHVDTLLKQYPTINTVWVNSGVQQSFSFADPNSVPSDEAIANEIIVNITAPTLLAKHFAPHLQKISKEQEAFLMITSSGITFVPAAAYPALRVCELSRLLPPYVATELDLKHKEAATSVEPMPLEEYTTKVLEIMESTKPADVKEVGVGFSEMAIKTWRGAFQPILEQVGAGAA
ncbi:putative oxido DltE [Cyphellophora attinorum]|uniref:Putative oxido DltE n=1 Tax=Cyphellophora attinorum TaxID=1664694 RepID=A0A0N1HBC6_9EURO|nr:putative oxido DltE [Phialophora attinorum]KPI45464.1 putative oxido DltE [Phialophora attinorum]